MSGLKEPHFIAFEGERPNFQGPGDQELYDYIVVSDIEAYRSLFRGAPKEAAIGEASTFYLCSSRACDRIRHHVPEAKLIAILRDPAERAYSNFLHLVRDGKEPLKDFARALRAEEDRIQHDRRGPLWLNKRDVSY